MYAAIKNVPEGLQRIEYVTCAEVLDGGVPAAKGEGLNGMEGLFTELAEGTLAETICVPTITWWAVVMMILQVAEGLAYLHSITSKRVLHLDVKPQSVLCFPGGVLKFCDFGTPAYTAPEQYDEEDRVSDLTDMYSLGVLTYELIAKVAP